MKKTYSLVLLSLVVLVFAFGFFGTTQAAGLCTDPDAKGIVPCGVGLYQQYRCEVYKNDQLIKTQTIGGNYDPYHDKYAEQICNQASIDAAGDSYKIIYLGQYPICPCQLGHFFVMISTIYNFIMIDIAIPVGGLMILIAGIMLLVSAGNPGLANLGKNTLKFTIIGIVLIFGAWLVINTIFVALGYVNQGTWYKPF